MSNFRIVTDSGSDLTQAMIDSLNISVVPLMVNFKGQTQPDNVDDGVQDFYNGLRAGEVATTSAINPTGWAEKIEPILAGGQDALVITFSSGLSTTYQSAVIAAEELAEKYPDRQIRGSGSADLVCLPEAGCRYVPGRFGSLAGGKQVYSVPLVHR